MIPDVDALGRPFGALDYEMAFGGHRGFTHSLLFAALFGAMMTWAVARDSPWRGERLRMWLCFALATASHGVLDALTNIGQGVMFFSPFVTERFSFLWRPIHQPGAAAGVNGPLLRILFLIGDELLWVGVPCVALWGAARLVRARGRARSNV